MKRVEDLLWSESSDDLVDWLEENQNCTSYCGRYNVADFLNMELCDVIDWLEENQDVKFEEVNDE